MAKSVLNAVILIVFLLLVASAALFTYTNLSTIYALAGQQTNLYLLGAMAFLALLFFALLIYSLAKQWKSASGSEIQAVLEMMDELLGKLPQGEIGRFSKSKDFELYERALKKHGVK